MNVTVIKDTLAMDTKCVPKLVLKNVFMANVAKVLIINVFVIWDTLDQTVIQIVVVMDIQHAKILDRDFVMIANIILKANFVIFVLKEVLEMLHHHKVRCLY